METRAEQSNCNYLCSRGAATGWGVPASRRRPEEFVCRVPGPTLNFNEPTKRARLAPEIGTLFISRRWGKTPLPASGVTRYCRPADGRKMSGAREAFD